MVALQRHAAGMPLADACKIAVYATLKDTAADNAEQGRAVPLGGMTDLAELVDVTTDAVDEVCTSWRPPAPDAAARTTIHDLADDVLACLPREHAHALTVARRLPLDTDGRSWRGREITGATLAHADGKTGRSAATKRAALARDAYAEAREAAPRVLALTQHRRTPRPWLRADTDRQYLGRLAAGRERAAQGRIPAGKGAVPTPATGPASMVLTRTRNGSTWLTYADRSVLVPAESVESVRAAVLARTAVTPYALTADDRAADHFAYLQTPVGPVTAPSSRRTKRDGGVGSPTITRGPRDDWRTRTQRADVVR